MSRRFLQQLPNSRACIDILANPKFCASTCSIQAPCRVQGEEEGKPLYRWVIPSPNPANRSADKQNQEVREKEHPPSPPPRLTPPPRPFGMPGTAGQTPRNRSAGARAHLPRRPGSRRRPRAEGGLAVAAAAAAAGGRAQGAGGRTCARALVCVCAGPGRLGACECVCVCVCVRVCVCVCVRAGWRGRVCACLRAGPLGALGNRLQDKCCPGGSATRALPRAHPRAPPRCPWPGAPGRRSPPPKREQARKEELQRRREVHFGLVKFSFKLGFVVRPGEGSGTAIQARGAELRDRRPGRSLGVRVDPPTQLRNKLCGAIPENGTR
ncbi:translation initiation factor IF-2-like [Camelus ferus]|uniref:Translation initiation factor IF-2-like n=1 Tax=Camelus ferus TaxID=419612 RepID=A0A8B8SYY3_CAMFR|nr:translation initiation factor IF-2-like [Camelus ferus]